MHSRRSIIPSDQSIGGISNINTETFACPILRLSSTFRPFIPSVQPKEVPQAASLSPYLTSQSILQAGDRSDWMHAVRQ